MRILSTAVFLLLTAGGAGSASADELEVSEAVRLALERNPELAVGRLAPEIVETTAYEERALFDPLVELEFGSETVEGRDLSSGGILFDYRTESPVGLATLTQLLPTGTHVEVAAGTEVEDASRDGQQLIRSRVGVTVSQPLLRDSRAAANLGRVRAARLEASAVRWEVRGLADWIAASVAHAGWDHALAERHVEVWDEAIEMARHLQAEIRARIDEGIIARSQLVAADAELALRLQERIDAIAARDAALALWIGLLDLHDSGESGNEWRPTRWPDGSLADPVALEHHVATALDLRPDVNQARTLVERGEVEVVRTRNGLLPRLDVFLTYGRSGYAATFSESWNAFGRDHMDVRFGVSLTRYIRNRDDKADYRRAKLETRQAGEALRNLERLARTDVELAHVEAGRARAKREALAITRDLDEQKLTVEEERFDLGLASSFQVARAQRDLIERRLDEATARAEYGKALVELYRLDGSLLRRYGITVADAGEGNDR